MAKHKVLAYTVDGRVTYCTSPPEKVGEGRCNHILHQEEGESDDSFMKRIQIKEKISSYHMSDEEAASLKEIKGRKHLDEEDNEGGYIQLDEAVWNSSNIQEFSELSGESVMNINKMLKGTLFIDPESLKKLSKKEMEENKNKVTGPKALNLLAEKHGYEATKRIYVLPYYMRKNMDNDIKHPLNVLYNALIVAKNKGIDKTQESYERLLNNRDVKRKGIKPLTDHGGFAKESLADLVNGKSGIMRKYITGFSIPNSGRGVAEPNAKMNYGEAGIPSSMAATIFEPTLISALEGKGVTKEQAKKWLNKIQNEKDVSDRDIIRLDRLLQENECRALIVRQPSLHMPSVVCFQTRVTEVVAAIGSDNPVSRTASDVIHMSPQVATGYNLDFDGDTHAVHAINDRDISETAWKEMSPFTKFVSHNPKNLKESLTVPTKDCLFGLYNILGN